MKNSYEAPEVFTISTTGSFVLGQKPWSIHEMDAIWGWGWSFWIWLSDLDEEEN